MTLARPGSAPFASTLTPNVRSAADATGRGGGRRVRGAIVAALAIGASSAPGRVETGAAAGFMTREASEPAHAMQFMPIPTVSSSSDRTLAASTQFD